VGADRRTLSEGEAHTLKNDVRRPVPVWAIAVISCVCLAVLGYFGWRALFGHDSAPGPPKKVYPGMYDIRDAARAGSAKPQGEASNGP
jgi:hypothetical protein